MKWRVSLGELHHSKAKPLGQNIRKTYIYIKTAIPEQMLWVLCSFWPPSEQISAHTENFYKGTFNPTWKDVSFKKLVHLLLKRKQKKKMTQGNRSKSLQTAAMHMKLSLGRCSKQSTPRVSSALFSGLMCTYVVWSRRGTSQDHLSSLEVH